jgi:CheY-like chemotaxis protein
MMKILVMENHPDIRELLVKILDLMGFSAITSRNGKKAVAEKPDLIAMEIMMREISGWRRLESCAAIPKQRIYRSSQQQCYSSIRPPEMYCCLM